MEAAAVGIIPTIYDPLRSLVVHGMEFSKEVRVDKRWGSIQKAAHFLSGEFSFPGWNVKTSISEGPFIKDLRSEDIIPENLPTLMAASVFNEIHPSSSRWFPLVASKHHANLAELIPMGNEVEERSEMLKWLKNMLVIPWHWRLLGRTRTVLTDELVRNVNVYLTSKQHQRDVLLGTDGIVSDLPTVAVFPENRNWNDFLEEFINTAASSDISLMETFLQKIPREVYYCPVKDKVTTVERSIIPEQDLAHMVVIMVIIRDILVMKRNISELTGKHLAFSHGPATAYVHWWSDYAWKRFDSNHGDYSKLIPDPLLIGYIRRWKGNLNITLHVAKQRAILAHAITERRREIDEIRRSLKLRDEDRIQIFKNTRKGRKKLEECQTLTFVDWVGTLKTTASDSVVKLPLRPEIAEYDRSMMDFSRRGLEDGFTTSKSVRADIVPNILNGKLWTKGGVMSKVNGRQPTNLVCGGDVVKSDPVTKTLFVYQGDSSWTEGEYPSAEQPLRMWADGYRTRALALLIFEHVVCGEVSRNGYDDLVREFERGVDLSGLCRPGRLKSIIGRAKGRKLSEISIAISELRLSTHMEASVLREVIHLCFESGLTNPFRVDRDAWKGCYLNLYGNRSDSGEIEFDCMISMSGLNCHLDEPPYLFGRRNVWSIRLYNAGEEKRAHINGTMHWNRAITSSGIRENIYIAPEQDHGTTE